MKKTIQLTVILTTHARSNHFHSLLGDLLQFDKDSIEVIIINDSSDVVTSQFIEKEIEKSSNDRVYLYEHDVPKGRGASLNEALMNANGMLVWAPLRADRLNESLLNEAIRKFNAEPAAFWVLDYNLPGAPLGWIHAADEGDLPDDSCLVWNRHVIKAEQFFFNPFLDQLHGAELAFRLIDGNVWYKTDPFFVVSDDQSSHANLPDLQEMLYTAMRITEDEEQRKLILQELADSQSRVNKRVTDDELLIQARRELQGGDANRSLELVNKFLKRNPNHHEASKLKVTSLEKLRRHVEAAELKHTLHKQQKEKEEEKQKKITTQAEFSEKTEGEPQESASGPEQKEIELTVIIPTTGHGKPLLENALIHLEEAVDAGTTELIIIDNASIDDTFDYLGQLKESAFLNINVITNPSNRGFAASVNQGIEAASGRYILVMHNDVILTNDSINTLKNAFEYSADTVITAPVLSVTNIPAQRKDAETEAGEKYITADRVDSCCFMIKNEVDIQFDEGYKLCFFDMEDFCRQIMVSGFNIVVARQAMVEHQRGGTTRMMGLELNPELKWVNRARYFEKWNDNRELNIPAEGTHPERFRKLGAPDNPMEPDQEWLELIRSYLTSEVRTEILRGKWSEDELFTILLTLLIADERELLRTMEDRIEGINPDNSLLILFVNYYYRKNIFSRCKHYINKAEKPHPIFEMYKLKIKMAEKEFDQAIPLLNNLLELYPTNPDLYYLAGELYRNSDEQGEAKSFFAMANQLDPFRFQSESPAFEIKL